MLSNKCMIDPDEIVNTLKFPMVNNNGKKKTLKAVAVVNSAQMSHIQQR